MLQGLKKSHTMQKFPLKAGSCDAKNDFFAADSSDLQDASAMCYPEGLQ